MKKALCLLCVWCLAACQSGGAQQQIYGELNGGVEVRVK